MKLSQLVIHGPRGDSANGCVVLLPGRAVPPSIMYSFFEEMRLPGTAAALVISRTGAWYPPPNGPDDQAGAVWGLRNATTEVAGHIERLAGLYGGHHRLVVLGFSAGAVVGNQVVTHSSSTFAANVCLGGAILEPEFIPTCQNDTPFYLQHNLGDDCFDWFERYVPMREGLRSRGWKVIPIERHYGSHTMYRQDARTLGDILRPKLNILGGK